MRKFGWILMIKTVISQCCFTVYAETLTARDPFNREYKMPCDEQAETLFKQLQEWQFKGMIQIPQSEYQKIWLASQNRWLTVATDLVPNELLPWQIESITTNEVIWQANLPNDCHQSLSWTMSLNPLGKE